jgi:hypothetical protein
MDLLQILDLVQVLLILFLATLGLSEGVYFLLFVLDSLLGLGDPFQQLFLCLLFLGLFLQSSLFLVGELVLGIVLGIPEESNPGLKLGLFCLHLL